MDGDCVRHSELATVSLLADMHQQYLIWLNIGLFADTGIISLMHQ